MGGRGITIYKYWEDDFTHFAYWCIKHGWKKGLEIDRIDNDKGYYPSNCRITTEATNSRNKRSNINIAINGVTKVLADWCIDFGIAHNTASRRVKRGVSVDKLFLKPKYRKVNRN